MYRIEHLSGTITGERKEGGGYLLGDEALLKIFSDLLQQGWELVGFCDNNRAVFRKASDWRSVLAGELEEARKFYFSAGMPESDIGGRDDPTWYWRRAAKRYRDLYEAERARVDPPPL